MVIRNPTQDELKLIEFLVSRCMELALQANWRERLVVSEMADGGMGGLTLFPDGVPCDKRLLGKQASECQFLDQDCVSVVATLNLDNHGKLFELDIWKVDFSRLIRIPVNDLKGM
jgi:hypothetical protein